MTDWISCRDKLPPRWKWVQVNSAGELFIAKRCGIFHSFWKFPSGIVDQWISSYDSWRKIDE